MSRLKDEVTLPDGTVVASYEEINRWLKANNLAWAGDYSDDFRKKVRLQQERADHRQTMSAFLHNYKRKIWNE
ncbi:MAG: hypothetical protein SO314_04835 [Alphaproteobacteria bacterium]|nr:hypothetical protein [Alphaproteobacteria bacterium]